MHASGLPFHQLRPKCALPVLFSVLSGETFELLVK